MQRILIVFITKKYSKFSVNSTATEGQVTLSCLVCLVYILVLLSILLTPLEGI